MGLWSGAQRVSPFSLLPEMGMAGRLVLFYSQGKYSGGTKHGGLAAGGETRDTTRERIEEKGIPRKRGREGEKEREAATNNEAMEELLRMRSRTRSAVPFTLGADIMEHCPFFLQPPLHFTSANNGRNDLETKRIGCSLHEYTVHAMKPILRSSLEVLILRQKSM